MRRLTIGALLGMALIHLVATLLVRGTYPGYALIVEVPLVVLAVWMSTRSRRAPTLASIVTAILIVYTAVRTGSRLGELEGGEVVAAALFFGLGLVSVIAGLATAANGRSTDAGTGESASWPGT